MTITDSLIKVSEWLNGGVCQKFKFKVPPGVKTEKNGSVARTVQLPMDDNYEYEEVSPVAFPLFIPTSDKLPPPIKSNMPSVCVQIVDGSDDVPKSTRDINVNLGISTWNPGVHTKDIYFPEGTEPGERPKYKSGYGGWMDVWNFVDAITRELEAITAIDGLYLAPDVPVKFGPYKEQESIPDFYPFWYAYVQFTLRSDYARNNPDYEDFL